MWSVFNNSFVLKTETPYGTNNQNISLLCTNKNYLVLFSSIRSQLIIGDMAMNVEFFKSK